MSIETKVEMLIANHVEHRKLERELDPQRFDVKKTIAEKCVQRPFPDTRKSSEVSNFNTEANMLDFEQETNGSPINEISSKTYILDSKSTLDKNFKEIRVKQEIYNVGLASVN